MKKILDSRIFWFAVSLLVAVIFWVYVTSMESDQYTRSFKGVSVEFAGNSVLNERGLVATDLNTNTVTVQLTGPRRIVASLSSDDIKASVNVSNITQAAKATMQYTISYPNGTDTSGITVLSKVPETVTFTVSKQTVKTVTVKGSFDGTVADGYIAEPAVFEPSTINLSGPEIYLDNVSYAFVKFGEGQVVDRTFSEETGFTLMTEDKEEADTNGIKADVDVVTATLPILKMKDVPLDVELIYKSGATESNTIVTIEPSTVRLAGDSQVLDGLNRITLATISLDSFESSFTATYPIVIDNSLVNVEGISEATVTIKVDGLQTKGFTVGSKNISIINVTEGYTADVLSKSVDVVLRGLPEDLESVKSENIRAVADLTDFDMTEGSNMVPVKVYVDGNENVGLVGEAKIQIKIKKAG